jgi:CheY-like chemotaxis protein
MPVAEDNETSQLMASELLTMQRFKVTLNSQEAIEYSRLVWVLRDIKMTEMDGLPAAYIIRQNSNTIPILALTTHALTLVFYLIHSA